jgi:Fe2+ or Zn2+ uptake regulation protein
VLDRDVHPIADRIRGTVSERQPGVSRATVHRTVDFQVQLRGICKDCRKEE